MRGLCGLRTHARARTHTRQLADIGVTMGCLCGKKLPVACRHILLHTIVKQGQGSVPSSSEHATPVRFQVLFSQTQLTMCRVDSVQHSRRYLYLLQAMRSGLGRAPV